jgi:hypothetical protein
MDGRHEFSLVFFSFSYCPLSWNSDLASCNNELVSLRIVYSNSYNSTYIQIRINPSGEVMEHPMVHYISKILI